MTTTITVEVPFGWGSTWPGTDFSWGDTFVAEFEANGSLVDLRPATDGDRDMERKLRNMLAAELDALLNPE